MMLLTIPEQHCSRWGGIPQENLSESNRLHIQILVEARRQGPWNIPVNWNRVDFGNERWTRFIFHSDLSTFDSDALTRLVFCAHEYAVRVTLSPCNMQCMYIDMHTRRAQRSDTMSIHPQTEIALLDFRKSIR